MEQCFFILYVLYGLSILGFLLLMYIHYCLEIYIIFHLICISATNFNLYSAFQFLFSDIVHDLTSIVLQNFIVFN